MNAIKRISILICLVIGCAITCEAQEGFRINGKIQGVPDGPLLLMSYEHGYLDTLGNVRTENGAFTFTGKVEGVETAYIMTADQKGVITMILENAEYTIEIGSQGIVIKGGKEQEIYNQFLAVNAALEQKMKKIKEEIQIAQQEQNGNKMQALEQQFYKAMEDALIREDELLQQYPDSYTAAFILASGGQKYPPDILKQKYEQLGEFAKNTPPGRSLGTMITKQQQVAVGHVAPNFSVQSPSGETISLSDLKGKVKLIDFWASWCAPCRQENPNVVQLYRKYHKAGLEILSISLDQDPQAWEQAIKADGLPWIQGRDQTSEVAGLFLVKQIPHTILLDENNVIIAKDLRGDALQKKVAGMLKKKK